jgi:hypothetical protein
MFPYVKKRHPHNVNSGVLKLRDIVPKPMFKIAPTVRNYARYSADG